MFYSHVINILFDTVTLFIAEKTDPQRVQSSLLVDFFTVLALLLANDTKPSGALDFLVNAI